MTVGAFRKYIDVRIFEHTNNDTQTEIEQFNRASLEIYTHYTLYSLTKQAITSDATDAHAHYNLNVVFFIFVKIEFRFGNEFIAEIKVKFY